MRSKYWLLVVLLLVVSTYWIFSGQEKSENFNLSSEGDQSIVASNKPSESPSSESMPPANKTKQKQPSPKTDEQDDPNELDQWLAQLENRRYSEDTSVEITSLAMEFESCGNNNSQWLFNNLEPSEKQQHIKTIMDDHCKQLVNDYPLLEYNQRYAGVETVFNQFPASTELGRYLQSHFVNSNGRPDNIEFSRGLVPLALNEGNAQMLYMADWISRFSLKNRLFDKQVIQGQHQDYLKTIQTIALTALSCDFQNGITCSPSASFMRDKCFTDEKFCGLDFNQWYVKAVTPGMDADVQLLKQHFQSQVPE